MYLNDKVATARFMGYGDPSVEVSAPDTTAMAPAGFTTLAPYIPGGGGIQSTISASNSGVAAGSRACPTGDWNSWCDCTYGGDLVSLAKCKSTPLGSLLSFAPWTIAGKAIRGLSGATPTPMAAPSVPAPSKGVFGLPGEMAMIGGGLAVVGLLGVAVFVKKSKRAKVRASAPTPALAGYRRKRRR